MLTAVESDVAPGLDDPLTLVFDLEDDEANLKIVAVEGNDPGSRRRNLHLVQYANQVRKGDAAEGSKKLE